MRSLQWNVLALLLAFSATAQAQTAVLTVPAGTVLPSITPAFTARAVGFGLARPLRYVLSAVGSTEPGAPVVYDTTIVSNDTVVPIQVTRPLPSEASLYFKLRILSTGTLASETPFIGPRVVPAWLVLLRPNDGGELDTRRPLFVWRSAPVSPLVGPWKYDLEVTTTTGMNNTVTVAATSGISDTT